MKATSACWKALRGRWFQSMDADGGHRNWPPARTLADAARPPRQAAAASATPSTPSASAASAAASAPSAAAAASLGELSPSGAGILLVEDVECSKADVRNLLLVECHSGTRYPHWTSQLIAGPDVELDSCAVLAGDDPERRA